MGMMPGMGKMKDQMAAAGLDDAIFRRQLAIISSMTKKERAQPELLKHSRKKRIAAGSGTSAADINKLLKMHRQMGDMMKAMGGKGKKRGMMGSLMGALGGGMGGGVPDLLVCAYGRFVPVEVKSDKGKLEPLQKAWWLERNLEPIVCRTVDEAVRVVNWLAAL